jgi:hypothetical protein
LNPKSHNHLALRKPKYFKEHFNVEHYLFEYQSQTESYFDQKKFWSIFVHKEPKKIGEGRTKASKILDAQLIERKKLIKVP